MSDKPSYRTNRVGEEVRAHVAKFLIGEGYAHINITAVQMTADLSIAKVYFTTLEKGEAIRKATQKTLRDLTPVMRSQIAKSLNMRRTPNLRFMYDAHAEQSQHMEDLFNSIEKQSSKPEEEN